MKRQEFDSTAAAEPERSGQILMAFKIVPGAEQESGFCDQILSLYMRRQSRSESR